jgi:hypothetical protein
MNTNKRTLKISLIHFNFLSGPNFFYATNMLQNEKEQDAKSYLQAHKIQDIIQNLTQGMLIDRPENPRSYIEKNLQHMRSIRVFCPKNRQRIKIMFCLQKRT